MQKIRAGICSTAFGVLMLSGLLLLTSSAAQAGQLVYKPINPSFGGSPFNGDFLLGTAQSQIQPEGGGGGGGGGGADFPDFGDIFGDIDTVIGVDTDDDTDG